MVRKLVGGLFLFLGLMALGEYDDLKPEVRYLALPLILLWMFLLFG